jgi:hypothetical protein
VSKDFRLFHGDGAAAAVASRHALYHYGDVALKISQDGAEITTAFLCFAQFFLALKKELLIA